jgi:pyruvate/2-oxoglutarate dehydrogenase complex dihydrolipoamide dehydrogenase (E3) component
MNLIKRRRVYKGWTKPKSYDRNMVVIGAGAAGLVSSLIGATVKAKVTLVEGHKMGGDCLNFGCVPSKALIKSAKVAEQMRNADRYGLTPVDPKYSFKAVMERVHAAIAAIEPNDSVERYTGLGVDVAEGHARIVDPWTVEITPHQGVAYRLTTRSIIIATGARPFVPPLPGIEDSGYLTSDTLWEVMANRDAPPARLTVLGGGPIGCELAQAFARLGSKVTLVEMAPRVMIREDEDVANLAAEALAESGVELLTAHRALRVEGKAIIVAGPDGAERSIDFDDLLVAVGRAARLTGFGLEELGIETGKTVAVNDYIETKYPNILAAGDVAGPYQFTHTASHTAWYASVNALFGTFRKFKVDYRVIPWTTYIDPEVARVGINEQEAKEQGIAHEVTLFPLHELDRAITDSATKGFVKLLTVPGKDKILGVTIVGEHAGDIIGEYVLAMRHGLGLNKILSTVHAYPSYIEANKFAAGRWKKANAPEWAFPWLERLHSWRRG